MNEEADLHPGIEWPHNRPFQIIGLGLNAVDCICVLPHFPRHSSKVEIEEMHRLGGGQAATATALCARWGLRARYLGRVGSDEMGEFSLQDLRREAMEVSVETIDGARTQCAVILVDRPSGERTILWQRDPALLYGEGEPRRELIVEGQLLHLDGHDQAASIRAARWAREAKMKVSLDIDRLQPGVEELLGLADFAVVTPNFLRRLTGHPDWRGGLRELGGLGPEIAGVTRGRDGAALLWRGHLVEVAGLDVEAVDTTGAGDVFHGAFAYGLLRNWGLRRCLEHANAAAALSCRRFGARGGIPDLSDVLALTQNRKRA